LEYLRAVVQLDNAEIAAAASAEERRKAQQAKVEHLKDSVESARREYAAGELNQADLLAYQAELLKAEAELPAADRAKATQPAAETTK
jgi:outer membrane protein TolC